METDFDRQPGAGTPAYAAERLLDTYFNLRKNELAKASLSRYKDTGPVLCCITLAKVARSIQ